jgi:hypothetical protein
MKSSVSKSASTSYRKRWSQVYQYPHELIRLSNSYTDIPKIKLPAYTQLTALSWFIEDAYLRLYYVSDDGHIRELSKDEYEDEDEDEDEFEDEDEDEDGGWVTTELAATQTVEKNSQIAALEQNDGGLIKIYHLVSTEKLGEMSFSKTHEEVQEKSSVL